MFRPPPISPLFPYTTLFRSCADRRPRARRGVGCCPRTSRGNGGYRPGIDRAAKRAGANRRARNRADSRVGRRDRKSTRLNSSHPSISYAVFCLKKKKKNQEL